MAPIQKTLNFFGLESDVIFKTFKDLLTGEKYIGFDIVQGNLESLVKVRITGPDDVDRIALFEMLEEKIRQSLGQYLFSSNEQGMEDIVGSLLFKRKITISVAESCTGGLIGNMLTDVPGSSRYFLGGVIAYGNQAKHDLLGVSSRTLEAFGAVSDPVVKEMAEGVRDIFKSGIGLAITGIAGPDGGSREKPVGTVHIGLSIGDDTYCGKYRFKGNRERVKQGSAMMALDWVRRYLNEDPFLPSL